MWTSKFEKYFIIILKSLPCDLTEPSEALFCYVMIDSSKNSFSVALACFEGAHWLSSAEQWFWLHTLLALNLWEFHHFLFSNLLLISISIYTSTSCLHSQQGKSFAFLKGWEKEVKLFQHLASHSVMSGQPLLILMPSSQSEHPRVLPCRVWLFWRLASSSSISLCPNS